MKNSKFNIQNSLIAKELVSLKNIKKVQQKYQDDDSVTLEEALVLEGLVSEWDIYATLAEKMHLEMVDLYRRVCIQLYPKI